MSDATPLVSVGIPTYNRPQGLRRTLEYICGQTYKNLEIIVSDNGSDDKGVASVLGAYGARDSRLRIFRQPSNIGPYRNFDFVLGQATGRYFMWATDDDTWEPDFVSELVRLLEGDEDCGLAFCSFDALDPSGKRIETYPEFLPLIRCFPARSAAERLQRYITQEESLGKANLTYGLFRRDVLQRAGDVMWQDPPPWGSDMLLVASVLALSNMAVCDRLLYHVGPHIIGEITRVSIGSFPRPSMQTRASRVRVALLRHAEYMAGYAKIAFATPGMSFAGRACVLSAVLRRFFALARRDVRTA
jgi:glycosyltransferase domain-containing protein